jgi:hypothetical protein
VISKTAFWFLSSKTKGCFCFYGIGSSLPIVSKSSNRKYFFKEQRGVPLGETKPSFGQFVDSCGIIHHP